LRLCPAGGVAADVLDEAGVAFSAAGAAFAGGAFGASGSAPDGVASKHTASGSLRHSYCHCRREKSARAGAMPTTASVTAIEAASRAIRSMLPYLDF